MGTIKKTPIFLKIELPEELKDIKTKIIEFINLKIENIRLTINREKFNHAERLRDSGILLVRTLEEVLEHNTTIAKEIVEHYISWSKKRQEKLKKQLIELIESRSIASSILEKWNLGGW